MIYPHRDPEIWDHSTPPELWGEWSYLIDVGMYKLNLNKFYRFGAEMVALRHGKLEETPGETWKRLSGPARWLRNLILDIDSIPAPNTGKAATELLEYLDVVMAEALERSRVSNPETVVTLTQFVKVLPLLTELERELEHESREANVFAVDNRCAYSTTILIERGENLLPELIRTAISDYARNELHEAGKCIAFNVPTAAGFHLLRGLESVLRNYYDALSGGAPRPKTKSGKDVAMTGYIDQVQQWANPKVISVLRQITELHRNPLNHPQDVLTEEDVVVIIGIVVSAITSMVNDASSKGHSSLS